MTSESAKKSKSKPKALAALKRAAKAALELARQTNTPCWVMVGDKIVDATKLPPKSAKRKKRGQ